MGDLVGGEPGVDYVSCYYCNWSGHSRWDPQREANELEAHLREEHPEELPDPDEIPKRGGPP